MDTLLSYYQQFMELSKINPIMSGIFGVWVAGVITWSFRNVPMRVWQFTKRQCIRHVNIVSVGPDGDNVNYNRFLNWYQRNEHSRLARTLQLLTVRLQGQRQSLVTAGYSTHYFFHKGYLYWFSKSVMQQQQGGDDLKETITVSGLFVSQARLLAFIDEFKWERPSDAEREPEVYLWRSLRMSGSSGHWGMSMPLRPRRLETVAISKDIRDRVMDAIRLFDTRQDWYDARGIAYKTSFEFTGPTGTGKTSFIRALATYFKRDLYVINLKEMRDDALLEALLAITDGSFILFEDYDSCLALWKREVMIADMQASGAGELDIKMSMKMREAGASNGPTLQGYLNAIDGVIPLHNCILFFTANNPEAIDPAVRREGRMDHKFVIGALDHDDIVAFVQGIYPDAKLPTHKFQPILGAALSKLLLDNVEDLQKFVDSIPITHLRGMFRAPQIIDEAAHMESSSHDFGTESGLSSVLLSKKPNAVDGKSLYPENGY